MVIFQILVKMNLCILGIFLLQMPRCCKLGQVWKKIWLNFKMMMLHVMGTLRRLSVIFGFWCAIHQICHCGTSAKFSPRQQQVQNFPQLVIKFILNIRTVEIPWLRVRISAGRALKERQCTLKGQAWYVNVRGSVHWKGV